MCSKLGKVPYVFPETYSCRCLPQTLCFNKIMLRNIKIIYHEFMGNIRKAQEKENLASAHYLKAAKLGSPKSQNEIGTRYNEGNGVTKDQVESARWYEKAADQGYMYAQANIGWAFYEGVGVTQSYEQSMSWYVKSAAQGHSESQYNLGLMYADAHGTKRDVISAIKWLQKAKDNGVEQANDALYKLQNKT